MLGVTRASGVAEFGTESALAGRWRKDVPVRPGCPAAERREFLRTQQTTILALVEDLGLDTLDDEAAPARLAVPDPDSGTAYNFYDHQFVNVQDMGMTVRVRAVSGVLDADTAAISGSRPGCPNRVARSWTRIRTRGGTKVRWSSPTRPQPPAPATERSPRTTSSPLGRAFAASGLAVGEGA